MAQVAVRLHVTSGCMAACHKWLHGCMSQVAACHKWLHVTSGCMAACHKWLHGCMSQVAAWLHGTSGCMAAWHKRHFGLHSVLLPTESRCCQNIELAIIMYSHRLRSCDRVYGKVKFLLKTLFVSFSMCVHRTRALYIYINV